MIILLQVFQPTGFHLATSPLSWQDSRLSLAMLEEEVPELME